LPNDILDIICLYLIKKEDDIFRKLSWKYKKIYLKNIKYLPSKLYEFNNNYYIVNTNNNNYYIVNTNIYLKDEIFYVLNGILDGNSWYDNNIKIFKFNILNKKINKSDNNNNYMINTLLLEYNKNIYTIFGYKLRFG